jgi:threonine/homoserine/homoserine lactone efflux protein
MPDLATYLAFLAAVLAMQAAPGPDTVLVVSRGVRQGRRTALWTVLGMTLGAGAVQVPLLALGVASIFQSSQLAFELLRWAGAGYLVWLGLRLLLGRAGVGSAHASARAHASGVAAAREGLITNLTNPAPMIFMLAFLPQFVEPAVGSVALQLAILGLTQKATGFAVLGATALASGAVGDWIARRPRFAAWQERLAGAVLIGLGLRVLFSDLRPAKG